MAQQQQTVLRVETNVQPDATISGSTTLSVTYTDNVTVTGSGTTLNPYTGTSITANGIAGSTMRFLVTGGTGSFNFTVTQPLAENVTLKYDYYVVNCYITHANGYESGIGGFSEYSVPTTTGTTVLSGHPFNVVDGDIITLNAVAGVFTGSATFTAWIDPYDTTTPPAIKTFDSLDLYGDIPIRLNKSFAEVQDISKRNSDYSIGLQIPGSKKNNRFFESYFNVDVDTLFYDVTKRVPCQVLIDDEKYFEGYLRLNKVSVLNSKVEYDITLYSSIGDLFGKIGNNLLRDLDYDDIDFHFNHYFSLLNVMKEWHYNSLTNGASVPSLWFYPIVHNGYNYTTDANNDAIVNVSGATQDATRLYTSTVASGYTSYAQFTGAGGLEYRVNSPRIPIMDNQLKPALNVWGLIQLMFKSYGYTIKSEFFNTPWFKLLYSYGMFSSDATKFGYKLQTIPEYGYNGVSVVLGNTTISGGTASVNIYVVERGTGIPVYCTQPITVNLFLFFFGFNYPVGPATIPAMSTGTTINANRPGTFNGLTSPQVPTSNFLKYLPVSVGGNVPYIDGDYIDFSLALNQDLKQIDFLSSIAKKFDLVFVPDPDVPNQIIIEPYDYYIGTGDIHDWTDKLSYDKGFEVQPSLNFIESEIVLTDLDDGDDGNKIFKDRNNRVYGENKVYNPTDFKSQTKKIDTIFSPEVIRRWDNRISIPLGINYASQNKPNESGNVQKVTWEYKGIKSKPKLLLFNGNFSPFIDQVGEAYTVTNLNTTAFRLQKSNGTNYGNITDAYGTFINPVISHTMPMGNPDENKSGRGFNNDSLCNLFNSEEPADIGLGIPTFNTYTENDIYSLFYTNRINNLFDKNTRFLSGFFDLKLSDIKNLRVNDIIKIKEQYFVLNKIDQYNYTNPELTKVELLQLNVEPKQYPDRYFLYQYCTGNNTIYKFKTYFNPEENSSITYYGEKTDSLRRTYFSWAILYDYMIGALGGNATGYTSSYYIPLDIAYYPYKIWEVDKATYESTGISHDYDPNNLYFVDKATFRPSGFDESDSSYIYAFTNQFSAPTQRFFFNVATDCVSYATLASQNYVDLEPGPSPRQFSYEATNCDGSGETLFFNSSGYPILGQVVKQSGKCYNIEYYYTYNAGYPVINDIYDNCDECLASITPTPAPATPIIGSLLMTFDELVDGRGGDLYQVYVNGILRDNHFTDAENLYSTHLNIGDVVQVLIVDNNTPTEKINYSVKRLDYTTDDEAGDMGIKEVTPSVSISTGSTFIQITFTATTASNAYNFEYKIDASIIPCLNAGSGFNDRVLPIIPLSNGKTIIGGAFTTYSGITSNRIIRLNADLTIDNTFNIGTGFNERVLTAILQPDGKIVAGGIFSTYNGNTRSGIIRLNTDGSIDNTFSIGTGFNNSVYDITIQTDGKLLVAGQFTSYNGTAASRIIRLNSNGSIDTSFNSGTGFNGVTESIAVQSDGKILVGGNNYTLYNGTTASRIIRLNTDGTVDTSFVYGTGFNGIVTKVVLQSDSKILVGGWFTSYNGTAAGRIIRLNSDGSIDNTFNIGTGFSTIVDDILIQTDGKILVGGWFTSYNGTAAGRIIRLNPNGSIDTSFNSGTGFTGATEIVFNLALQSDGSIYAGGDLSTYNGQTIGNFIKLTDYGDSLIC